MPIRLIREGILTSERVNALTAHAELFYRRLMSVVDDYGRYSAHPTLLRASCYPLKLDSVKEDSIKKHLAECVDAGLIVLFTVAGKAYLELQDFRQQIRAKASKYPSSDEGMRSTCEADAKQVMATAHLDVVGDEVEDGGEKRERCAQPDGVVPDSGCPPATQSDRSPRATRLPEGWELPREWGEWALGERPDWGKESLGQVAERFRDYWLGKAGADARKINWQATWRNWVRREKSLSGAMNLQTRSVNGMNRQEALEARNRAVVARMLSDEIPTGGEYG